MNEVIKGDVLTKSEMKQRGISMVAGTRGGMEFRAPTYDDLIAAVLKKRGFIDDKHINAACDYLELKNSVYGFLNAKTIAGIFNTGDAGLSRAYAEAGYYAAARYLGRANERLITHAMNSAADETLDMIMVVNDYRTAFLTVFDAMDLALQKISEEMQKELV